MAINALKVTEVRIEPKVTKYKEGYNIIDNEGREMFIPENLVTNYNEKSYSKKETKIVSITISIEVAK